MDKNIKIITIVLAVSFGCAMAVNNQVIAARKYIPSAQDLQPKPDQAAPNLSGNANFQEADLLKQSEGEGEAAGEGAAVQLEESPAVTEIPKKQGAGGLNIFLWVIISGAVLFAAGWLWWKKYAKK